MREALRTGDGLAGRSSSSPRRASTTSTGTATARSGWTPAETRAAAACCPACGKPVTVGVLHRVEALADRPEGAAAGGAAGVPHLVAAAGDRRRDLGVGPKTKTCNGEVDRLVAALGPELAILQDVPLDEVAAVGAAAAGRGASPGCGAARCSREPGTTASTA